MTCVLFAKMDKVFGLKKKKNFKKILENRKKYWKSQGKVRNFVSLEKWEPLVSGGSKGGGSSPPHPTFHFHAVSCKKCKITGWRTSLGS